jgi:hypothetical protein
MNEKDKRRKQKRFFIFINLISKNKIKEIFWLVSWKQLKLLCSN